MKTDFQQSSKIPAAPGFSVNKNASNSKKKRYKDLQFKTLAHDFLSNISLTSEDDRWLKGRLDAAENTKKLYFDKIISNEFDCFLSFNKINTKQDNQTEYFNYYKQRVLTENPNGNRFSKFLQNEFEQNTVTKFYVDQVLARTKENENDIQKNKSSIKQPENVTIPSIKILSSNQKATTNDLDEETPIFSNKRIVQDLEIDYIKQTLENGSLHLNTSNLTLSSTSSNSIHLANSLALAASGFKSRQKLSSKDSDQNMNAALSHNYSRTLSESSGESSTSNIIVSRNLHNTLNSTNSKSGVFKRSLFQNLRRLTNEKLILTSNNSPIGIFSRKI